MIEASQVIQNSASTFNGTFVNTTLVGNNITLNYTGNSGTSTYYNVSGMNGYQQYTGTDYATSRNSVIGNYPSAASGDIRAGQNNVSQSDTRTIRGFMTLNTTNLPDDANITNATVYLRVTGNNIATQFRMILVQATFNNSNISYSTYSNFSGWASSGNYNTVNLSLAVNATTGLSTETWVSFQLNSAGYSYINKTGLTKFVLLDEKDIANTPPNDTSNIVFNVPLINVTYTEPYYSTGTYNSSVIDAGSSVQWNNLTWVNTSVISANISFQVSSCQLSNCTGSKFIGPDNTSSTYFTSSPISLNTTITPNARYFQYKVFFATANTNVTPTLNNVTIDYSSTTAPSLNITYPTNSTNSSNTQLNVNYTVTGTSPTCVWSNTSGMNNYSIGCGTNITNQTWAQGRINITVYANNSAGLSSSSISFYIDNIAPSISISYPTNSTNSTNTQLNVNYTVSDSGIGLSNCWWTNTSGMNNYSIGCGTNITNQTWAQGRINITVYANDSVGNLNSSQISFYIDNVAPSLSIVYPNNNTYFNYQNVTINYTISDSGIGLSSCWWSNSSGMFNYSMGCGVNVTNVTWNDQMLHNITIYSNDTLNNLAVAEVTIHIDTVKPAINFYLPTNDNLTAINSSRNFNMSVSDAYLYQKNYTIFYPNLTVAYTNFTDNINGTLGVTTLWINDYFNITNRPDGNYTIQLFTTDMHTDANWNPVASVSPISNGYDFKLDNNDVGISVSGIEKSALSVSSSLNNFDYLKLPDRYSFNIKFSDNVKSINMTITADKIVPVNTQWKGHLIIDDKYWFDTEPYSSSIVEQGKGYAIINIKANDNKILSFNSLGGLNDVTQYVTFKLDTQPPYFTNNVTTPTLIANGTSVNFTMTVHDIGSQISSVSFGLWNIVTKAWEWSVPSAVGPIYSIITTITDKYSGASWNMTDVVGNNNVTNTTFPTFDEINPSLNITYPFTNSTNSSNTQLNVNYTVSDVNLQSCWWSNNSINYSMACGVNITNQTWKQGLTTIKIYANDSVNNINSSQITFFIDNIAPTFNNLRNFNQSVNTSFSQSITATDSGIGMYNYYLNQTTNFTIDSTGLITNKTRLDFLYIYYLNITAEDYAGNNATGIFYINVSLLSDKEYPQFSSFTNYPDNNSVFSPSQVYSFNSTITKTNGTAGIEFNGVNYTMGNISSTIFNSSLIGLSGGNFSYYFWSYGNGTNHNYNISSMQEYTIAKATPTLSLTSSLGWTINASTHSTITGVCPSGLTCNLYEDYYAVSNPFTTIFPAGDYYFNTTTAGNANYTGGDFGTFNVLHSLYNSTNQGSYNSTYNQWAYNQTQAAINYSTNYTNAMNQSIFDWANSVFLKISDMFSKLDIMNMISGNRTQSESQTNNAITANASNIWNAVQNYSGDQCPLGNYTYGYYQNGTPKCRSENISGTGNAAYNQTYNDAIIYLNSTKAGIGNCPAGYVIMNITANGVQCINASLGGGTINNTYVNNTYINNTYINNTYFSNNYTINQNITRNVFIVNITSAQCKKIEPNKLGGVIVKTNCVDIK